MLPRSLPIRRGHAFRAPHDKPFSEIETELARFPPLPQVRGIGIDSTGIGMQLAERAKQAYPRARRKCSRKAARTECAPYLAQVPKFT